jgi:hypothetical protein
MTGILDGAGLEVVYCAADPDVAAPGVFAKARKPPGWRWRGRPAAWDTAQVTPVGATEGTDET